MISREGANGILDERAQPDRIALFMPALEGGGAERVMLVLAESFCTRGYRVDLVLTRATGAYISQVPAHVRVIDLHAKRIVAALPALARYLRRERLPIILSALTPCNLLALWARSLACRRTKVVVVEHNTISQETMYANARRARLLPMFMRRWYPRADGIVAVSHGAADDLAKTIRIPRERIRVIYNPVVSGRMLRKAEEPVDHPWFVPGAPPVILGTGRLTTAKDFQTLIRAFARLRQSHPARLMILGEGPERLQLEGLARQLHIEHDVALPGFVGNPYQYMKASAVFVLSSRWEGLGNVLIEAMACGVTVVSTDCPSGPAEILEDGIWGQLVPLGDEGELSIAIEKALAASGRNPALRAAYFSAERAVEGYENLILGAC